jgi:hypothetical protein
LFNFQKSISESESTTMQSLLHDEKVGSYFIPTHVQDGNILHMFRLKERGKGGIHHNFCSVRIYLQFQLISIFHLFLGY